MSSPRAVGGKLRLKGGVPLNRKYAFASVSFIVYDQKSDSKLTLFMNDSRKRKRDVDQDGETVKREMEQVLPVDLPESRMVESEADTREIPASYGSNKTAAQLAFERQVRKTEKETMSATAALPYRQRIDEYNKRLASLSEHHDLPKVGPG